MEKVKEGQVRVKATTRGRRFPARSYWVRYRIAVPVAKHLKRRGNVIDVDESAGRLMADHKLVEIVGLYEPPPSTRQSTSKRSSRGSAKAKGDSPEEDEE